MKTTGYKIRKIRERNNLTQEYVADQLDISQNAYSKIENDQTQLTIDRLLKLIKILGDCKKELLSSIFDISFQNSEPNEKEHRRVNDLFETRKKLFEQTIELLKSELKEAHSENKRLLNIVEQKLLPPRAYSPKPAKSYH